MLAFTDTTAALASVSDINKEAVVLTDLAAAAVAHAINADFVDNFANALVSSGSGTKLADSMARVAALVRNEADLNIAARDDYKWLIEFTGKTAIATRAAAPTAFFDRPLWPMLGAGYEWEQVWTRWRAALTGARLADIYERHSQMVNGKGLNWEEAEKWLERWIEDSGKTVHKKATASSTHTSREVQIPLTRPQLERMLRIHQAIQSGEFPNASSLARELEVSNKSIQRDIEFMRDRLVLPIQYDSGKTGYYYSEEVSAFPPIPKDLTTSETEQNEAASRLDSEDKKPTSPKPETSAAESEQPRTSSTEPKSEFRLFEDGFTPSAMGDQPSKHDHLGREKLARVLAAMFASKAQGTPFTVAILGEWGSGKSTLMELIRKELELDQPRRKGGFDIAVFNAWEYEHTDNIRAGLAQEVVKGLTSELKGWRSCFKRWWFTWVYATTEHRTDLIRILTGLIAVILIASVTGGLALRWLENPIVKDLVKTGAIAGVVTFLIAAWKNLRTIIRHPLATELTTYLKLPSYGEHLGQVPVIKQQLKSLCDLRLILSKDEKTTERRLVVFVDDLDRCSPKCITDTLDAIRLVMNIPGVIVVIMIDHRIAMKAVARQYASLADGKQNEFAIARDYLGKIIQVPITLMPAAPEKMDEFIKESLFPSAKSKYHLEEVMNDTGIKPSDAAPNIPNTTVPLPAGQTAPATPVSSPTTSAASVPPSAPATPTKTPEQVAKEQERIEEEMQDTVDDREFFQRLVKAFGFNNPRQLLRMRNSFRVLKGIERGNTDQSVTPEKAKQMMLVLFWLELINDLPAVERTRLQCEVMTAIPPPKKISAESRVFLDIFTEVYGWDGFGERRAEFRAFLFFVSRFVLPHYDGTESVSKHAEDADDLNSASNQTSAVSN